MKIYLLVYEQVFAHCLRTSVQPMRNGLRIRFGNLPDNIRKVFGPGSSDRQDPEDACKVPVLDSRGLHTQVETNLLQYRLGLDSSHDLSPVYASLNQSTQNASGGALHASKTLSGKTGSLRPVVWYVLACRSISGDWNWQLFPAAERTHQPRFACVSPDLLVEMTDQHGN
jgi:hypothetical protein